MSVRTHDNTNLVSLSSASKPQLIYINLRNPMEHCIHSQIYHDDGAAVHRMRVALVTTRELPLGVLSLQQLQHPDIESSPGRIHDQHLAIVALTLRDSLLRGEAFEEHFLTELLFTRYCPYRHFTRVGKILTVYSNNRIFPTYIQV